MGRRYDHLLRYGSTALVTGASSGIGASFCRGLAQSGFSTIIAVARREDRLEELRQELQVAHRCTIIPIPLDLSRPGAATELYDRTVGQGMTINVLVNNAGFGVLGAHESIHLEKISGMIDLNCKAVVEIAAKFLPGMKQRQCGAMIVTSSVVGAVPAPWFATYSATKAFDLYFGEALHAECRGTGVDVLTVLPGLTRTEFQAGAGLREYHSPYRSAEQVVETAFSALGRKSIVVDGVFNKLLVHGTRFIPRNVVLFISRVIMRMELAPPKS